MGRLEGLSLAGIVECIYAILVLGMRLLGVRRGIKAFGILSELIINFKMVTCSGCGLETRNYKQRSTRDIFGNRVGIPNNFCPDCFDGLKNKGYINSLFGSGEVWI